ncbi:MAG: phage minor head protein, partial [Crocinitomicaceae bacterium]|nr:phage minor head protein [Crocinitomicaceae bacterium]
MNDQYSFNIGADVSELEIDAILTEKQIQDILKKIFKGSKDIPADVYQKTYEKLSLGVSTGYGDAKTPNDVQMIWQLKNNVAIFSAFKANHYGETMRDLLIDKNGDKRVWGDFLKEAKKIDADYNKTRLAAEYNMAIKSARTAQLWQNFERDKDVYPNLIYMPSRSATPREIHKQYYGLILPVDHPFWDTGMPPQGWGCSCWVKQTREDASTGEINIPEETKGLSGNPGKTGMIFTASTLYMASLSKKSKDEVQAFLNEKKAQNVEMIIYPIGKNYIEIPVTADGRDLIQNIDFLTPFVKKYKENYSIRPHLGEGKKPELQKGKMIGDLTTWETAKTIKNYINGNFKQKYGDQLKQFKEVFVSYDFDGNLSKENYFEMWRALY